MRLRELYIDGFGHFHGQTVGPLDSGITVLYGPNEAGKSTLLAFIRTILFGFRRSGRSQFYPPLAGGKHGGRITLCDDEGNIHTLERYEGAKGGPYVLRTNSGETLTDPATLERLTGHATLDLFSNVFAFSLDEIQSEGLVNDEEISGRLYSAGMGASVLPEFIRKLDKRREDLFRPRGNTQEIVVLIRKLSYVADKLRDIQGNAKLYRELTTRQAEISMQLTETDSEISNLNTSRTEIQRLLEGWEDWVALEDCEAKLKDIPKFEKFPENSIERLQDLQSRIRTARDERDQAADELRQIEEAVETPIPNEAMLNDAESIETIRRGRTRFDDSAHNLPKLQKKLGELEDSLSKRLRALGQDWNEENLDTVDTSSTIRQQSEDFRETLRNHADEVEQTRIRLEGSQKLLKDLQDEEQQAYGNLQADSTTGNSIGLHPPNGSLVELLDDQKQIERIRSDRGSFNNSVRDLPKRLAELDAQEKDVGKRMRDLGQNWDEARLENFDTSIEFRQETDKWRDTLADVEVQVRQNKERLERENSELVNRQNDLNGAQSQVPLKPSIEASKLETRRNALRTSRSRLGEYIGSKNNLENLQEQLTSLTSNQTSKETPSESPPTTLAAILGLVGLVLILFGIYLGEETLTLGALGGLTTLAVAAYLLFRRQASPATAKNPLADAIAQNIKNAKLVTEEAEKLLLEASRPLDLDNEPTAETLDNAEAKLDLASNALSVWNQADLKVKDARSALEAQQKRFDEATKQANSVISSEKESQQRWQKWLAQHGLPEGFTPDTVVDFTGRVDVIREKIDGMRQMQKRVSAIKADIEEYMKMVRTLATKYRIPFEEADDQRVVSVADTLIENIDSVRRLVTQYDDVKRRLNEQKQAMTVTSNEYDRTVKSLREKQTEWHNWLREHGFDSDFNPETLLEFLAQAETAKISSAETQETRDQVEDVKTNIEEFRNQVKPLAETYGISLDSADIAQLPAVADSLIRKLEETQKLFRERQQEQQTKEQKEQSLKNLNSRLLLAEEELARFLKLGGADDEESLRHRVKQYEQRLQLEAQTDKHLQRLSVLSGPDDERLAAFRKSLESSGPDQLKEDSRTLSEQIDDVNRRRDELRDERTENNLKLNQLSSEDESSALRIEHNILMEQLREKASEWSRLTIAGELLRQTQQKFEKERQPSVIQHAENFFSSVTGKRYQRLYAPIGKQTITVTDEAGRDKIPSQLSRGTREQLYLALRFGLIREFGKHAEHLPVIVDEALVNFDSERAVLAAGAFAELSQTNQVLVFTCHRAIADMFANVGATVVDIDQQGKT